MKRKFTNIHEFSEAKTIFHEKGATIVPLALRNSGTSRILIKNLPFLLLQVEPEVEPEVELVYNCFPNHSII